MPFRPTFVSVAMLLVICLSTPASADLSCDAIEGEDALYGDAIQAFALTVAPPGCDQKWSQAMRARRNAILSDGIVVREETWGLLAEETSENCAVDGTTIETGHVSRLSLRCETRYRCTDGTAEITTDTSCERAP